MKRNSSIIWGIVLVILGVILGGNALNLFNVDIFFDGWWTLFIIVPSFIGLFNDNDKKGHVIGLIIGVLLLLACNDIVDFDLIFKLIVPIIIVVIGLSLIFKNTGKIDSEIKKISEKNEVKEEYCATFSGQDIKIGKQEFNGTTINAIFGGVKLDLSEAIMKEDIVINTCSIFGGIEITVPSNVSIKIKSNSIFGGVDNKKKNAEGEITIYLNSTCIFGGVDIK